MNTNIKAMTIVFQLIHISIYVFASMTLPGCASQDYSLYRAIYDRENDKAAKLIAEGANLETVVNKDGWTALLLSVSRNDYSLTEQLLQAGGKVNVQLKNGKTPLHLAAENDNIAIIKLLLQHKAKIDITNEAGATPLYQAATYGKERAVEALLEAGANYKLMYKKEWTPINSAAYNGYRKIVETLHHYGSEYTIYVHAALNNLEEVREAIRSGEDLTKSGPNGYTPLNFAVKKECFEVVDFLIKNGADVRQRDNDGYSVIFTAASDGKTKMVKFLMERGAVINEISTNGASPLYFAAKNGHLSTVKYLIEQGANAEIGYGEWTPLSASANNGYAEVVKVLLESGRVQIDAATKDGETALYKASRKGHADVVKLLLDAGANTETGYKEWRPLSVSADEGHVEVVKILLESGRVQIDAATKDGETALYKASRKGHADVVKLLLDAGVDPQKGYNGWSSLHAAVNRGHIVAAETLLDHGASVTVKIPSTGETPIDIAKKRNNSNILALLADDYGKKALKKAKKHINTGDKDTMIKILADAVNYYDAKINEQEKAVAKLEKRLKELTYVSPLNQVLQSIAMSSGNYGVYGQTVSNQMGINDARSQLPEDIKKEKRLQSVYKKLKDKYAVKLNCLKNNRDIAECFSDIAHDAE
jgi:serine/threonine-protein phosphatase 6 regulatory ankyrin repeat subunit B